MINLEAQSTSQNAEDAFRFWGASSSNQVVRELSHWADIGIWGKNSTWLDWGRQNFTLFERLCRITNHKRPLGSMLEWGPGGGANAAAFAGEAERFYGVDISDANLAECARQFYSQPLTRGKSFEALLIDVEQPRSVLQSLKETVDFFLCTAVFQHFPSKAYGTQVTEVAYQALRSDGIDLIQIRYNDGSEDLEPKTRDYIKNVFSFTTYSIDEYWTIASQTGFVPLSVVIDPQSHYAFYLLRKNP